MSMPPSLPDIHAYADFRLYLEDAFRSLKRANPKFSQRYIQGKVGASSSGWFSDVVKGRIALTSHMRLRLSGFLGHSTEEAEYFEILVDYLQAGSAEEKDRLLERLLERRDVKADVLGQDKFDFYRDWHHSAIRELLSFHRFDGDYTALARRLDPPIRPVQARESIKLLLALGLIEDAGKGSFRPTSTIIRKDAAVQSLYMRGYSKKKIELGMQAVDRFEKEHRDISSMTLSLSKENFAKAQAELKAVRKKLLKLAERQQKPDHVYQVNFQAFPITR